MFKKIMLISILSFVSCAAIAAEVRCPLPENVRTNGKVQIEDGIPGFIYCSPSTLECKWKGIDPISDEASPVVSVNNPGNKATQHNGLTYCDYTLKNGSQIRMALEK
ncbi:hypothetical protein C1Y41_04490 [Pantoea sp. ICBG 1758]|uniref:hypothetical protein n=1 Tax=Pantoea sp. ICBG 1758 TaxID=2071682 RepID=UPI000CE38584|nr:hypothetical protein [Pantoea sp. ICBG 1758]PPC63908.1 hypothetical protein C1Y41_04490 [Pantoea sp. ICBG 1758]